jgi:glycogen synthase
MTHLILCREYPPAPYPAGGIGTYVKHIARLLAEAGETVHLIAQRWHGAPERVSAHFNGRLIVHRVSLDEPVREGTGLADAQLLSGLASSDCPSQVFSWQAAQLAECLIESESIDVIEAQEWEAPLYYLQVRRALGLGPRKEPPCLIHLHSPSQLIFRHNEWDETLTDFLPLCRFEEYSVKAADALLCPSRYLARGAGALFGFEPAAAEVVPYPIGDASFIERAPDIWDRNSICYFGRLELRKGVVEWVDAAVKAAGSHPTVRFEFIGNDTSLGGSVGRSVEEFLKERIPRRLRPRFLFHGGRSRAELFRLLAEVSVAVVPSRWENLPFTCIEAMASGLPVLASPNGGMVELVTDGLNGWVARDGTASGLESALEKVLDTSPGKRAAMGREAAAAVRRICANDGVLERHIEVRAGLAASGATRSRLVPDTSFPRPHEDLDRRGFGIVVTCLERPDLVPGCLENISAQIVPPKAIIVIIHERFRKPIGDSLSVGAYAAAADHLSVLYTTEASPDAAWHPGADALLSMHPRLRAVALVSEKVRLAPLYVREAESVFERQPGVGLTLSWISHEGGNELDTGPCPVSARGFTSRDPVEYAAVRVEVFRAAQRLREASPAATGWEAISEALASGGWSAVTYPDLLVSVLPSAGRSRRTKPHKRYSVMALAQSVSPTLALKWFLGAPWREKARWLRQGIQQPRRFLRLIAWQWRRPSRRAPSPDGS